MSIDLNETTQMALRTAGLGTGALAMTLALAMGLWRGAKIIRYLAKIFVSLDEARNESRDMTALVQKLATQVMELERSVNDRLQLAAASGTVQRGYDLALQMARSGSAPEAIVSSSGVTQLEAQLLVRLHHPQTH
jgi:Protein of unknown function (DUF2802)